MWPFEKKFSFPGVKLNSDGSIDFSLTDEEIIEVEIAMKMFQGYAVHPDVFEKVRNGTTAAALSKYACNLINYLNLDFISKLEYKSKWNVIKPTLEKAIASEWKAYSLYPLPIFLYHRGFFMFIYGKKREAKELFKLFIEKQIAFNPDEVDKLIMKYEGTDPKKSISSAQEFIQMLLKTP
jgi:hypothetical protein